MNGLPQSIYGVENDISDPEHTAHRSRPSTVPAAPAPSRNRPPLTVGALREATTAAAKKRVTVTAPPPPRVPIVQRVKEPEVPARLKQKRKTIAFGVTTNVSQTVERDMDPPIAAATRTLAAMSLARAGVGAAPAAAARTLAPIGTAAARGGGGGGGDENRPPQAAAVKEEKGSVVAHLEASVARLERERAQQAEEHLELKSHFAKLVKMVAILGERMAELELRSVGGEGGRKEQRSSEEDEDVRPLNRTQYSSDEELNKTAGGGGRRREQRGGGGGGGGLLDDQEAVRALNRQLAANPLLRQQLQDALDQDKYEHDHGGRREQQRRRGGGRGTTVSPSSPTGGARRRRVHVQHNFDDDDDVNEEERAPAGRCGGGAAPPAHRLWKEERTTRRQRVTPPAATEWDRGGAGGRLAKKRSDVTPSRRRVTERVTMERVHHFDDTDDESDGGGMGAYERYDSDEQQQQYRPPRTLYDEEIVESVDYKSLTQPNGRGGTYGRQPPPPAPAARRHQPPQPLQYMVTEVSDSEDDLSRRKRQLMARIEARMARLDNDR